MENFQPVAGTIAEALALIEYVKEEVSLNGCSEQFEKEYRKRVQDLTSTIGEENGLPVLQSLSSLPKSTRLQDRSQEELESFRLWYLENM